MWHTSIFELARQRGWTDAELARRLGVNQSTVCRLRQGQQGPGRKIVFAASALFGQSAVQLFWEVPTDGKGAA